MPVSSHSQAEACSAPTPQHQGLFQNSLTESQDSTAYEAVSALPLYGCVTLRKVIVPSENGDYYEWSKDHEGSYKMIFKVLRKSLDKLNDSFPLSYWFHF